MMEKRIDYIKAIEAVVSKYWRAYWRRRYAGELAAVALPARRVEADPDETLDSIVEAAFELEEKVYKKEAPL